MPRRTPPPGRRPWHDLLNLMAGGAVITTACAWASPDGATRPGSTPDSDPARASAAWRALPAYPRDLGVAGVIAGQHGGVLIAAGGTNFPDRPWREGGQRVTYDDMYVLKPGATAWSEAGRLPRPLAYAAVVSRPEGVIVVGGADDAGPRDEVFRLTWEGARVRHEDLPALPQARTGAAAVVLNDHLYVAGGFGPEQPRSSSRNFWRLDLAAPETGWQILPAWPGPSRAQAVIAAMAGAVYLISGLEEEPGADGSTRTTYLEDAYRFYPETGWMELPAPPRSAVAAPSPAPVLTVPARLFVLGGVNGRLVGRQPVDTRVPDEILVFDLARGAWRVAAERWPEPVVTGPTFRLGDEWIVVSGEMMAGIRTPQVWAGRPGAWELGD
jgi:N-acetylneuraminate epimerase